MRGVGVGLVVIACVLRAAMHVERGRMGREGGALHRSADSDGAAEREVSEVSCMSPGTRCGDDAASVSVQGLLRVAGKVVVVVEAEGCGGRRALRSVGAEGCCAGFRGECWGHLIC